MGAFLDKPMTEKTVCSGEGKTLKYGMSAMQGWRKDMEDAHVCQIDFGWDGWSIFGVFDGHAGAGVSKFLSENIVDCIKKKTDFSGEDVEKVREGVKKGFMDVDECLLKDPEYKNGINRGGSTAIAVLISSKHIIWANCGDSRGFLCQNGGVAWATEDHKPHNAKEKERIEKAGGTVMNQRVNGTLAVSRALGDFEYKQNLSIPPHEQLVSPEPDVTVLPRKQGDEFIFLACDGVYDVMTNEEIAKYIRHKLELTDDHSQICSDLIDYCLNKVYNHTMCPCIVLYKCCILMKLFSVACTYYLYVSWTSHYTSRGEEVCVHLYFVYILDLQGDLNCWIFPCCVETKIAFMMYFSHVRMCTQVYICALNVHTHVY